MRFPFDREVRALCSTYHLSVPGSRDAGKVLTVSSALPSPFLSFHDTIIAHIFRHFRQVLNFFSFSIFLFSVHIIFIY